MCAKKAEAIEMLFGLWARMGTRNHVLGLDGNPEVLRDVAIAANFGTQSAITGFLWSPYVIGQTIIFSSCGFFFFFFSSPNPSGRRLDVYHTSTHGVAL